MNAKSKRFITNKLIPFILREQGNGFAMSTWKETRDIYPGRAFDDVERTKAPVCGTVACIGGSTALLIDRPRVTNNAILGKSLGLTKVQANALFYKWEPGDRETGTGWPESFAQRFYEADTPIRKARVAVALLKHIMKRGGEVLENHDANS